jgi:hypothetical protein
MSDTEKRINSELESIDFGVISLNDFFKTLNKEVKHKILKISNKSEQKKYLEDIISNHKKEKVYMIEPIDLSISEQKGEIKKLEKEIKEMKETKEIEEGEIEEGEIEEIEKKETKEELEKKELEEGEIDEGVIAKIDEDGYGSEEEKEDTDVQRKEISNPSLKAKQFDNIVRIFYETNPYLYSSEIYHELEVKFGTKNIKNIKPFIRIDYDNVIKKLKSSGFRIKGDSSGEYYLRINCEFLDTTSGKFRTSDIRTEIKGLYNIQNYCKNNDIKTLYTTNPAVISFIRKRKAKINEEKIFPVDNDDFNFRVSYQTEEKIKQNIRTSIIENWKESKKNFRYINRVSFEHPENPFIIDVSISKTGNYTKDSRGYSVPIMVNTISESNLFQNDEKYEIEIEVDNAKIGPGTIYNNPKIIADTLRKTIKTVLSGLQKTNYPISYPEQHNVIIKYMKMIWKDKYDPFTRITSKYFIGPNSVTLQLINIAQVDENCNEPNIRNGFVVTEKADGHRHLMYISDEGKIYLINTNMDVIFTGAKTINKKCFNTLLDGELILHDKTGSFINLYAAFDVYYIKNDDIRSYLFMSEKDIETEASRYQLLSHIVQNINPISIECVSKSNSKKVTDLLQPYQKKDLLSPIGITIKEFFPLDDENIFSGCKQILQKEKEQLFAYNTDGLIFTHKYYGVGSNKIGEAGPKMKITWENSFKWKPPQFNTIDFLITTVKNPNGDDLVKPLFEDGMNTDSSVQYAQYKVIELRCGFSETRDGFINPCQNIIDDDLPDFRKKGNDTNDYMPTIFYPTEPYDPDAGICNIMLREDDSGIAQMFTDEGDIFEDKTIVEFRYDLTRENGWKWVPLRVRYDKTAKLRRGEPEYGNSYNTCNQNWKSIHPSGRIEEEMLSSGENIPGINVTEDKYYNATAGKFKTGSMKNFHNLYVKKKLICGVSKPGDTLIDFACGKAGDLPKWINAKLSFVFGIDLSKDNLENRLDGACARFLKDKKNFKTIPYALFVNGNSAFNIRDGSAMLNDKAKQITNAVFGNSPMNEKNGKGVNRQYSKGSSGFHISSCQFAIHYFFESADTLKGFIKNVSDCTMHNGYFIGTCYDGELVFNELRKLDKGQSIKIIENEKKIWEIIKGYNYQTFDDDSSSIGYRIDVYQESINQLISEYLVNFNYLDRIMRNYGFEIINDEEAKTFGFPKGSGLFRELFLKMQKEISTNKFEAKNYGQANFMTENEKKISFLNRYFIYKKVTVVNTDSIQLDFTEYHDAVLLQTNEHEQKEEIPEITKEEIVVTKPKIRKLKSKIVLVPATEAIDEEVIIPIKPSKKKIVIKEKGKKDILPNPIVEEMEEEVIISNPLNKANKPKKCDKGFRRNKKTGECEPNPLVKEKDKKDILPNPIVEEIEEEVIISKPLNKDNKPKKCDKGTRKNKKTGECEKKPEK